MNPEQSRLEALFKKYFEKTATPEERAELSELIDHASDPEIKQLLTHEWGGYKGDGQVIASEKSDEILERIFEKSKPGKVVEMDSRKNLRWWKYVAAAMIISIIIVGILLVGNHSSDKQIAKHEIKTDIQPGTNGAVLTLADGKKIILDSTDNGEVSIQDNTKIVKLSDGQLAYEVNGEQTQVLYNSLTTDKGKQFHVKLPDGTDVWLNSASSLRYPTAFLGDERRVEVTGEAYFEVTKDASKPFIVSTKGQEVRVLGTHFNVNAYDDENAMRTTLLEGSVKITSGNHNTLIKPGEQSIVTGGNIKVETVNVNDAVAWKNGFFSFRQTGIRGIMRQLSRWYNLEIKYEGVDPVETFTGKIDRTLTLAEVLKALEKTGAHFRIEEGRKLIILP